MKIEIEKPVVPGWFDRWYFTFPDNPYKKEKAIYHLIRVGWTWKEELTDHSENVIDNWEEKLKKISAKHGNATEYLCKAILYGYEVEQEPLYYAKIKGWELTTNGKVFWNYRSTIFNPLFSRVYVDDKEDKELVKTNMTIEHWNKLGINDTNADFEKVEE